MTLEHLFEPIGSGFLENGSKRKFNETLNVLEDILSTTLMIIGFFVIYFMVIKLLLLPDFLFKIDLLIS